MEYRTDKASRAFTEWMRRFIEEPDAFVTDFEAVSKYSAGGKIVYGDTMAAYFEKLMGEV